MKQPRERKKQTISAFEQGVRLLAQRDHSIAEIRRKLVQRNFEQVEIDEALDRMVERKFLDDERTARLWAEQELRRHGQGRTKALNRMLEHGLSREHAVAALDELWDREIERDHAHSTLARLTASIPPHELRSRKSQASLARRLASRGFDMELIRELLSGLDGTESGSL
jgi:regulatory protein